ncbi:hypothetical protein HN587_02585 [Candidatus Woesearchaeota archaeon]|jgi:hypothetical protein|nr:hypothetical protein [Candidatus Woesearchaeota archaeon]
MSELEELRERMMATDFTPNNPGIQRVIEKEFKRWVESYDHKNEPKVRMTDCYGSKGDIPEHIFYEDCAYTPHEILEHVKSRDDIGMKLLWQVHNYSLEAEFHIDVRDAINPMIATEADLDKQIIGCMCGCSQFTGREVMQSYIDVSEDAPLLGVGLSDAIMKLYSDPETHELNSDQPIPFQQDDPYVPLGTVLIDLAVQKGRSICAKIAKYLPGF